MRQIHRACVFVLLSFVVGCATTKATVSGGVYQSPLNNFSVPLSNWAGLKMQEQNDNEGGRVSFHDDFGNLSAITYLRLPADAESTLKDDDRRDAAYSSFLKNYAVPSLFRQASPGTQVVHEGFMGDGENRTYFAVVSLPEGSVLVDLKQNKRLDSVRGVFIFAKRGFIYMIESEMSNIFSKVNPSSLTSKELESSQLTLKQVKDSMAFK